MKINFTKMSGAGNDFVVIDNRTKFIKQPKLVAQKLCGSRQWGIGADGLLLLEKSNIADFKMMYYNSDGSYGGMCGNGGRCIAMYAYKNKIAGANQSFEALNHIYTAKILKDNVSLQMKDVLSSQNNSSILIDDKKIHYSFVDTGAPHVIVDISEFDFKNDLNNFDVDKYGRLIRYHKKFSPKGTNVNFIKRLNKNTVQLRTYERGVEAETLACGTGSVATAIIANNKWNMNPPIKIIPTSKSKLIINFNVDKDSTIRKVTLTGPAITTFTGTIII